jgi:hypothetical protein
MVQTMYLDSPFVTTIAFRQLPRTEYFIGGPLFLRAVVEDGRPPDTGGEELNWL